MGHEERKRSRVSTFPFAHRTDADERGYRNHSEPQCRQVLRPCRNLERRPNPRAGADRKFRADILPLAELALHRRPYARSEEHTSEIQSLMCISYTVLCLKKTRTYTKQSCTSK